MYDNEYESDDKNKDNDNTIVIEYRIQIKFIIILNYSISTRILLMINDDN